MTDVSNPPEYARTQLGMNAFPQYEKTAGPRNTAQAGILTPRQPLRKAAQIVNAMMSMIRCFVVRSRTFRAPRPAAFEIARIHRC
jgi:hypothetical protein